MPEDARDVEIELGPVDAEEPSGNTGAPKSLVGRIPAAVWGLVALAIGMVLGSYFPDQLGFIGTGVKEAFGYLAKGAPYIIFFTLTAAIGDMLKTGSAARFALWVSVTYVITTVVAGVWAIAVLAPLFQLPLGLTAQNPFGAVADLFRQLGVLAVTSPPFIAIMWATTCGVGLHFGAKYRPSEWFARPTFDVIRLVGVDGIAVAGRALTYLFPFILFAIGVFIPTGISDSIAKTESGIAEAGALDVFADVSPVSWYLISVAVAVFILTTFMIATSWAICRYTGFSWKRFFKEYFLYVYPFAWGTASSAATIPINLERAETGLGVRKEVRDFIIPLGATVNLDGTMVAAFVITVIAGTIVGYTPSVFDLLLLLIPLTVVTIGVPGIPGGVAIIAPPVIASVLPIPPEMVAAFIAIFFGFSIGLSDQFRTGVNSVDNGLICMLYEHWYPSKFARKDVPVEVPVEGPPARDPAPGSGAAPSRTDHAEDVPSGTLASEAKRR